MKGRKRRGGGAVSEQIERLERRTLFAVPSVHLASDTGISPADRLTRTPALSLDGTATASTPLHIYVDGTLSASPTSDADGHWSTTLSQLLSDGSHSITAAEVSGGGVDGALSAPVVVRVDTTAPGATLAAVPTPAPGDTKIDFVVVYDDAFGVDVSSIGTGDLVVARSGAAQLTPTFTGSTTTDGGKHLTATYRLSIPGGITADANGTYAVSLADQQVRDFAGNEIGADSLGQVVVNVTALPVETTPPVASIGDVVAPPRDSDHWDFAVTYSDNVSVDGATVGAGDVTVTGPGGVSLPATLVSHTAAGTGGTAVYRVAAPGGFFDPADNGDYTVNVNAGAVKDVAGNGVAAMAFGPFALSLAAPAAGPDLSGRVTAAPAVVRPGSKGNVVTLKVTNGGTKAFGGKVTAKLYAMSAAAAAFDPAAAVALGSTSVALAVGAKKSTTATVKFDAPKAISEGNYKVVAVLDAGKGVKEQYKSNNTLVAGKATHFVAPASDLAVTFETVPTGVTWLKGGLLVTLTNKGNTTAVGPAEVRLFASDDRALDAAADTLLFSKSPLLTLKPGQSKTLGMTVVSAPSLAGKNEYLVASVSFSGRPADKNAANDVVFSKKAIPFTGPPVVLTGAKGIAFSRTKVELT